MIYYWCKDDKMRKRKCEVCGATISKNDAFCKSCGNSIKKDKDITDAVIEDPNNKDNTKFLLTTISIIIIIILVLLIYFLLFGN